MTKNTTPLLRTNKSLFALIALALALTACSTRPRSASGNYPQQGNQQTMQQNQAGNAVNQTTINSSLTQKLGGQWTLRALPANPSLMLISVPMTFSNGQASGSDGCNNIGMRYFGGDRGLVQFDPSTMVSTRMACQSPSIQNFSTAYTQILGQVRNYQVNGNALTMFNANMQPLAVYEARSSSSLTGSEWKIAGYNNGKGGVVSTNNPAVLRVNFGANGNVGVFAGCNASVGRYTVDGVTGQMTISNLVNSRKKCTKNIMAVENAILKALPRVATYSQTVNGVELRDANGSIQALLQNVN